MNNIPLSLYVHFPWCVKKCPYCDFNSHVADGIPEAQYLDSLLDDLHAESQDEPRDKLHSVFIGGGTPSLISPATMQTLMQAVGDRYAIDDCEITIEANPGTFDQSHFDGYFKAGINRISIGAQSFDGRSLSELGRVHNPHDIVRSYGGARKAGFKRINLDIMHGLPGQTPAMASADLKAAIELGPEHISWYQLTIEPNTVFYRQPPVLPLDDALENIIDAGMEQLISAGFRQYEVSAFSQPGERSAHNLNYWQFGDYLGIGAGAHGKLTRNGNVIRTNKTRVPKDYMASETPKSQRVTVPEKELQLEFLLNTLRLNEGFSLELFESRTGLPGSSLTQFIDKATDAGFIEPEHAERVVPTSRGRWFLNDLLLLA